MVMRACNMHPPSRVSQSDGQPEETHMTAHRILLVVACLALWACAGSATSPSTSPGATAVATTAPSSASIVLHETPANLGCDSVGIDYKSMTFHIDTAAAEQVSAMTDTGVSLVTYWPAGFTVGTAAKRAVRDDAGMAVATDGETLKAGEKLHGYYVCLAPTKIYVMLAAPSG
jgi:hypothetical protein